MKEKVHPNTKEATNAANEVINAARKEVALAFEHEARSLLESSGLNFASTLHTARLHNSVARLLLTGVAIIDGSVRIIYSQLDQVSSLEKPHVSAESLDFNDLQLLVQKIKDSISLTKNHE